MSRYALISDQDIVSDSNSKMELLKHLEKDFDTNEYRDFFKGGKAVLVKIIVIDEEVNDERLS